MTRGSTSADFRSPESPLSLVEDNSDQSSHVLKLVLQLRDSLTRLECIAKPWTLEPLAGRSWFELLTRKLIPQLEDNPYLIVAVMGGTNIGKSVLFNHIAGFRASASSPLASGTKHPVCLIPSHFDEQHDLKKCFPDLNCDPGNAITDSYCVRCHRCGGNNRWR